MNDTTNRARRNARTVASLSVALACTLGAAELADAFDPAWYLRHVDEVYRRFGL
jgi:hypothetical protein